jgi:hypothetical protein
VRLSRSRHCRRCMHDLTHHIPLCNATCVCALHMPPIYLWTAVACDQAVVFLQMTPFCCSACRAHSQPCGASWTAAAGHCCRACRSAAACKVARVCVRQSRRGCIASSRRTQRLQHQCSSGSASAHRPCSHGEVVGGLHVKVGSSAHLPAIEASCDAQSRLCRIGCQTRPAAWLAATEASSAAGFS